MQNNLNEYTRITNEVLEALSIFGLTGGEFSVCLTVIRKTWGWGKKEDWISYSQLEKCTNLSRMGVWKTIKTLKEKNILLVNQSVPSKPKYKFNKNHLEWTSKPELTSKLERTSKPQFTQLVNHSLQLVVNHSVPTKETITKETITKEIKKINKKKIGLHFPKENELTQKDFDELSEKYNVPVSFVISKWDDLINYCYSKNKKYKDFKRTLAGFVKRDSLKIRKEHNEQRQSKSSIAYFKG